MTVDLDVASIRDLEGGAPCPDLAPFGWNTASRCCGCDAPHRGFVTAGGGFTVEPQRYKAFSIFGGPPGAARSLLQHAGARP
jgi:hypothetical protein